MSCEVPSWRTIRCIDDTVRHTYTPHGDVPRPAAIQIGVTPSRGSTDVIQTPTLRDAHMDSLSHMNGMVTGDSNDMVAGQGRRNVRKSEGP